MAVTTDLILTDVKGYNKNKYLVVSHSAPIVKTCSRKVIDKSKVSLCGLARIRQNNCKLYWKLPKMSIVQCFDQIEMFVRHHKIETANSAKHPPESH